MFRDAIIWLQYSLWNLNFQNNLKFKTHKFPVLICFGSMKNDIAFKLTLILKLVKFCLLFCTIFKRLPKLQLRIILLSIHKWFFSGSFIKYDFEGNFYEQLSFKSSNECVF